jgi:hypothetical protein
MMGNDYPTELYKYYSEKIMENMYILHATKVGKLYSGNTFLDHLMDSTKVKEYAKCAV